MRTESPQSRGFTLLEVIVVLVITSLITTILMQGLSVVLGAKLRFSDVLSGIEERGLQHSIMTSPLKGLIPDYEAGADTFAGNEQRLRGLTLTPLQGLNGAPTSIALSIDYNVSSNFTELTYFEKSYEPLTIAQWPGNIGDFSYRGRTGDWETNWPPPGDDDDILQAPRSIRIITGLEQNYVFVQVLAPEKRPFRTQDIPIGSSQ